MVGTGISDGIGEVIPPLAGVAAVEVVGLDADRIGIRFHAGHLIGTSLVGVLVVGEAPVRCAIGLHGGALDGVTAVVGHDTAHLAAGSQLGREHRSVARGHDDCCGAKIPEVHIVVPLVEMVFVIDAGDVVARGRHR